MVNKKIGILALQGAYEKHAQAVASLGATPVYVKNIEELNSVSGLIMPGGESTTISKLLIKTNLFGAIQEKGKKGFPIFGTCAGLILLASEILHYDQPKLDLLSVTVERNFYGRQIESFETDISVALTNDAKKSTYHAIFIRAPKITKIDANVVKVLAHYENDPVLVQQNNLLAATFHPELTEDLTIHEYFFWMC